MKSMEWKFVPFSPSLLLRNLKKDGNSPFPFKRGWIVKINEWESVLSSFSCKVLSSWYNSCPVLKEVNKCVQLSPRVKPSAILTTSYPIVLLYPLTKASMSNSWHPSMRLPRLPIWFGGWRISPGSSQSLIMTLDNSNVKELNLTIMTESKLELSPSFSCSSNHLEKDFRLHTAEVSHGY